MTTRKFITILIVLLAVAAIPAAVAQQGASDGGGDGSESAPGETAPDEYTRLAVSVDDGYPDLKPGERAEVTVTVRNLDEDEVTISPTVEYLARGDEPLPEDWLEFETDSATLEPDEETEFTVTIDVPGDAELGRYHGVLSVTDERVEYPGQPARPLHAASLGVTVYEDPTVHVRSQRYVHGQIEAGEDATAEIVVENTGQEAVPLNPEIDAERRVVSRPGGGGVLDPAWVSIDAPGEIEPGERETVEVSVEPPADAETGNYRTEIDLGVRDPARPEDDTYWRRINLDVNVWSQPEEPYVRDFVVSEDTETLELRLTPRSGYGSTAFEDESEPGTFEVTLEGPGGESITPERVRVSDRGSVDMTGGQPRGFDEDGYTDGSAVSEYVYEVEEPASGEWSVEIEPENTIGFGYEIVRHETDG